MIQAFFCRLFNLFAQPLCNVWCSRECRWYVKVGNILNMRRFMLCTPWYLFNSHIKKYNLVHMWIYLIYCLWYQLLIGQLMSAAHWWLARWYQLLIGLLMSAAQWPVISAANWQTDVSCSLTNHLSRFLRRQNTEDCLG